MTGQARKQKGEQAQTPTEQASDTTVVTTPTSVPVEIWEIIIDQLLAYRPGNGWALTCNPNEQSLEGAAAQSFLNCRATCTAFDHYMLGWLLRFTMRPIKYLRDPILFEIEFEQREFRVSATHRAPNDVLYSEFRKYSQELLRVRRELVRTNEVHDRKQRLHHDNPEVQFWISLDEASQPGPVGRQSSPCLLSRQSAPWFLSRKDRNALHRQCLKAAWTPEEYEDNMNEEDARHEMMDDLFSQAADRDDASQQASPEQSEDSNA